MQAGLVTQRQPALKAPSKRGALVAGRANLIPSTVESPRSTCPTTLQARRMR